MVLLINPLSKLLVALLYILPLDGVGLIELKKVSDEIQINSNERRSDNTIAQIDHTIEFKNIHSADIIIKQVITDDNVCIAKDWKFGPIHPGEFGFIKLTQKNIPTGDGDESEVKIKVVFGLFNAEPNFSKVVEISIKRKVKEEDD